MRAGLRKYGVTVLLNPGIDDYATPVYWNNMLDDGFTLGL
jgi:hypothetical protein